MSHDGDPLFGSIAGEPRTWWSDERHKVELSEQRDRVIEECARVAESCSYKPGQFPPDVVDSIAAAIRALKEKT